MKKMKVAYIVLVVLFFCSCGSVAQADDGAGKRKTVISIVDDQFYINGKPTFPGRVWNGHRIEGLLPNSRMVQGIFDDENPETVSTFAYPDSGEWDADRNTQEFIDAMPSWYSHGLLSFTINMQGGSPLGYGNRGWINTAFDHAGNLKPAFMNRLEKILDKADELGMVPILGLFYFGQDQYMDDDEAVKNATVNAVKWILEKGYRNVLIEIANECDNRGYERDIIKKDRAHELIELAQGMELNGHRLLVSTSFNGGVVPSPNVVDVVDFVLFHGNGVHDPLRMIEIVNQIRAMPQYKGQPIVCNEDDHYDFDKEMNNFVATTSVYASWGLFDFRRQGEDFSEGFQTVPVDWTISTDRKKGFFNLLNEITGMNHNQVFVEKDGIIKIDMGNVAFTDHWQYRTDVKGYDGAGYLMWAGDEYFGDTSHGHLEYKIQINRPGSYMFKWRTRVGKGTDNTEHNDTWVNIAGAADYYGKRTDGHVVRPYGVCTDDCPQGTGGNGYFKVYGAYHDRWDWHGSTSDHDAHDIYADFHEPGIYTIRLAARSSWHLIDKLVLFHTGMTSLEEASQTVE